MNDRTRSHLPVRILILGGTGQIGPFQVDYALRRGHHVTVFNRGRRPADLPGEVVHLNGDRSTGDLSSLTGRDWDAVIDNPARVPHWVRDVGEVLRGRTEHYVFVSTISVYAERRTPGTDEATRLRRYEDGDPLTASLEMLERDYGRLYGPLKAECEAEAERCFPGMTTIVRPGLIVGPRDESGRFAYWPVRIAEGGEVLAPGTPDDPVQLIDGRDLAEWMIRMVEERATGVYNANGPAAPLTMGELLERMRAAIGSDARFTWVDQDFLEREGVRGWTDMPVWEPRTPDNAGVGRASITRAVAQGLTFRPLPETVRDTLAWYMSRPESERPRLRGRFTRERERRVLAAWHATTTRG